MKSFNVCALLFTGALLFVSCGADYFFDQPTVKVESVELDGLPSETVTIKVKCKIKNNDFMEADVKKIKYRVTFPEQNIASAEMTYKKGFSIDGDRSKTRDLPLTLQTAGAITLLNKLDAGETLKFEVDGSIYADTLIGDVKLSLDVQGTTDVKVGFEAHFEQPEVTVSSYTVDSNPVGFPPPVTVNMLADIKVKNVDPNYGADVSEVKYTVTIEGVRSVKEEVYTNSFSIASGETLSLTDMPFTLNTLEAATLLTKSTVSFVIEGTFKATANIDGAEMTFYLPLYTTGETTLSNPYN